MNKPNISREEFIMMGSKTFLILTGAGIIFPHCSSNSKLKIKFSKFEEIFAFIGNYREEKKVEFNGKWTFPQMINHCAQSIEYSMKGFPLNKSPLFQNTIGTIAFKYFSFRGEMNHSLSEPIPGAPEISSNLGVRESIDKLFKVMTDFLNYRGDLAPHFAYGALNKEEYIKAHSYHIANHLVELI